MHMDGFMCLISVSCDDKFLLAEDFLKNGGERDVSSTIKVVTYLH